MRDEREELRIFVERQMHFINIWTFYNDLLSKKYVPSVNAAEEWSITAPGTTMMFLLYAYFYSLIEDSGDGLNGFRVWRAAFPEEEDAIDAVERQVDPSRDRLRHFRNRLGFHGSRTRQRESKGLELFDKHSGTELWNAMENVKALGSALLAKDLAQRSEGTKSESEVREWIDRVAERAQSQVRVGSL
jgi:hypothetical protein